MQATQRRLPSLGVRRWLVGQLPRAEFAVAMLDDAQVSIEVGDENGIGGAAIGVEGVATLSGAPVLVAVVADGVLARRALALPLLTLTMGAGTLEILGPGDVAADLTRELALRVGGTARSVMEQRLMIATEAMVPWHVPGWMRRMVDADHETVRRWLDEFSVEALDSRPRGPEGWRDEVEEVGAAMRIWDVGGTPVAMALARRSSPHGHRIGPVFTPPALRRRGYAAALTAHLTKELLDRGDRQVVLLTDVRNPTSNHVYRGVGYVEVDAHASWVVRVPA